MVVYVVHSPEGVLAIYDNEQAAKDHVEKIKDLFYDGDEVFYLDYSLQSEFDSTVV